MWNYKIAALFDYIYELDSTAITITNLTERS